MYLALTLLGCSPTLDKATNESAARPTRRLTVAGYTTPREVYERTIFPLFAAEWSTKTGEELTFEATWQSSGALARAVREGLEADVVALSLDPDVAILEEAGLVTHHWRAGPHGGMVTQSLVVLAVRPGNPKQIRDWPDLTRPDVKVLTPNLRTSGGAMWNVLALVGASIRRGEPTYVVVDQLSRVLDRVEVMDKGARESLVTFEKGVGDVAITYENEVLGARRSGQRLDYVVPRSTILIENPLVVVDQYASKRGNHDLAEAFVRFCHSPVAQEAYAEYGLRPVDTTTTPAHLPAPADLFTVRDLGGWANVKRDVFGAGGLYEQATAKAP